MVWLDFSEGEKVEKGGIRLDIALNYVVRLAAHVSNE